MTTLVTKRAGAIAATLLAATLAAMVRTHSAQADPTEHRVLIGTIDTPRVDVTTWWHPGGSSLDLIDYWEPQAGKRIAWTSKHWYGDKVMKLIVIPYTGLCTGVRLNAVDNASGSPLGDYWYTHISPAVAEYSWWKTGMNEATTVQDVGTILGDENNNCKNAGLWTGPHLHQGGDNSAGTAIYTHWDLETHSFPDSDGDGWRELWTMPPELYTHSYNW